MSKAAVDAARPQPHWELGRAHHKLLGKHVPIVIDLHAFGRVISPQNTCALTPVIAARKPLAIQANSRQSLCFACV